MISFYPGPSRVHDEIPGYVEDALKKGILSINHRSEEFMEISRKTISLLKKKLNIPQEFTIYYTSSATECWEIIAQSLVEKNSYHLFNGSFGQKWFDYTKRIVPAAKQFPFEPEEIINPNKIKVNGSGVICLTQNETSNGTQVHSTIIRSVKENNPDLLVAVDATSSMAGISLEFDAADIWFASVQKCFGLPAGLALMICSPKAIESVRRIGENNHYNSLTFMNEMMDKWQTPFTPNVLNIYLLMRVLKDSHPVKATHKKIVKRYDHWIEVLEGIDGLEHLIRNKDAHSYTVLPVKADADTIARIKRKAKKSGFLLGEGYGTLKSSTFRIANFPAIKKDEIKKLERFLKTFA